MAYHSKYSGVEVDALLDKIKDDNVGSIDSSLSTTSDNPVKNKVITEELNKKANKTDIATVNGQPLTNGGNIEVITNAYDDTEIKGKLTDLDSQIGAEATARTNVDAELQTQINSKQEALTLTVKDNGNIVLANIQGQSKEFMPATPSGDPMHYAYVAAGAEYNDTGADIVKDAPWADMLDDNPEDDGTKYGYEYSKVLHKAGCWYLNGVGDLSNNDMVQIYNHTNNFVRFAMDNLTSVYYGTPARTNIIPNKTIWWTVKQQVSIRDMMANSQMEVINLNEYAESHPITPGNCISTFSRCESLRFIINAHFNVEKAERLDDTFSRTLNLIGVFLQKISKNVSFKDCSKLSKKSILYMIQKEAATSAITITLHADAYARAMADAYILAALEQHTNISLASA